MNFPTLFVPEPAGFRAHPKMQWRLNTSPGTLRIFAYLFVGLLFVGCALAPTPTSIPPTPTPRFQNSPEGVVRKILEAVERQDANQYLDALDPTLRNQPNYFFANALIKGLQSYLGLGGAGDLTQVAFQELSLSTNNMSANIANVVVKGKMRNLAIATETDFSGTFFTRNLNGTWYVSSEEAAFPTTRSGLRVIPAELEKSDPYDGWINYILKLEVENTTDQFLSNPELTVEQGTVSTKEGANYPVTLCIWDESFQRCPAKIQYMAPLEFVLPPHFRIRGATDGNIYDFGPHGGFRTAYYRIEFRAAEAAHPTRVDIPSLGSFNLLNLPKSKSMIDSSISQGFAKVGSTIKVNDSYTFTPLGIGSCNDPVRPQDTCFNWRIQNLNALNDTQVNLNKEMVYPNGWIQLQAPVHVVLGPNQSMSKGDFQVRVDYHPAYVVFWGDTQFVVSLTEP